MLSVGFEPIIASRKKVRENRIEGNVDALCFAIPGAHFLDRSLYVVEVAAD